MIWSNKIRIIKALGLTNHKLDRDEKDNRKKTGEKMEVNIALSYRNSFHFVYREYYSQQDYSKQGQPKS